MAKGKRRKKQYKPGTYKGTYSIKTEKRLDRVGLVLIAIIAVGLVYLLFFHTNFPGNQLELQPWGPHGSQFQALSKFQPTGQL